MRDVPKVSVETIGDAALPRVTLRGVEHLYDPHSDTLEITLDTLDEANALRDALSAFIAFHRRFTPETGEQEVVYG
jgi:hypothetical protein